MASFVQAQPPFQEFMGQDGLQIEYQKIEYLQIGEPFEVNAHVFNLSNGVFMTNDTTDCFFHGYYKNGSHAIKTEMIFEAPFDWKLDIPGEFFTGGKGSWIMQCNSTDAGGIGGFASGMVYINGSGFELTTSLSIAYIGLILFLFCLFLLSLVATFRMKNFIAQFIVFWVTFLLFFAITFICYQLTDSYFLQVEFLGTFFWIIYWILLIGTIPLFLSSMAYLFYIVTYNDHFKKLVEKGVSPEEALKINDRNINPFKNNRR